VTLDRHFLILKNFMLFGLFFSYIFFAASYSLAAASPSPNPSSDTWRQVERYETQFQDCLLSRIPLMMAQKVSFVGFQIYLTVTCIDERKALRDAVLYFGPVFWPKKSRDEILVLYDYKERFSRDEVIRAHVKAMGFE
jgi:hypothetical protein